MAEDFDSDTRLLCSERRRVSELSEIESDQQPSLEQKQLSNSLSPERKHSEFVSSAKELRKTETGLLTKSKCFSSDASQAKANNNVVSVQENQGTEEYKLVCEKGKELNNYQVGISGNRVFGVDDSSNKGLATSCVVIFDENEYGNRLKNQQGESLVEPAVESIPDAMRPPHLSKFTDFESKIEIMGDAMPIKIKQDFDNSSTVEIMGDTNGQGSVCDKVEGLRGNGDTSSLKIEVIDETAVIETTSACKVRNGSEKDKGFVGFAELSERNGHKNVMKQETDVKKEKRCRRRGKGAKKLSGTNGKENILTHMNESQNFRKNKGDKAKKAYLRQEMEALQFVDLEAQRKKWIEVYCGLASTVAREYDGLIDCNHQKHIQFNFDPRQQFCNKEKTPGVLGEDCSQIKDNEIENASHWVEDNYTVREGEHSAEYDSDDDYNSIQRPALLVTGKPNFDSGPPQDGLEYLRRVRWEAAQFPKVKVAKLERSKLNKEQTVYMPKIPNIAKCPEHLLPLKQWENTFIADFSELRLALSRLDSCTANISAELHFSSIVHEEESSNRLLENIIVENFDNLTTNGDGDGDGVEALDCSMPENYNDPQSFSTVDENNDSRSFENSNPKFVASGSSSDGPTLSAILRMDSVARLSMLRKRISIVETMSSVSRNDCAWIFALCAAIDTPLDADTCAALRCLLRKSASLRAEKSEMDDEVIMLNILSTITGKYFGQSEF